MIYTQNANFHNQFLFCISQHDWLFFTFKSWKISEIHSTLYIYIDYIDFIDYIDWSAKENITQRIALKHYGTNIHKITYSNGDIKNILVSTLLVLIRFIRSNFLHSIRFYKCIEKRVLSIKMKQLYKIMERRIE